MTMMSVALSALLLAVSSPEPTWQPVGAIKQMTNIDGGGLRLRAEEPTTVGQLSSPIALPTGCDAVMISAELSDAAAHAVSLSVHDAESGAPIAYWLNPVPVEPATLESVVLDLAQPARAVRVFVGAHDRATNASVRRIKITPMRRTGVYRSVQYGAAVGPGKTAGQTFKAAGPRFGGISVHLRYTDQGAATPPDLTARLYAWQGDPASSRTGEVLAEVTIPGRLVPTGRGSVERDLMLPLDAALTVGQRYFVEVSDGSGGATPGTAFHLLFAGPDALPDGQHFVGDAPKDWDLRCSIYVREW